MVKVNASCILLLLLLLVMCRSTGHTQIRTVDRRVVTTAEVERFVPELMRAAGVPGLSLAIINDSRIVYSRGFGLRNTETNAPVTEETVFEAGSLSKPVFTYVVLRLAEQGRINLDQPLHRYLPWADIEQDERYRLITARMVLSHTSGFVNLRWINPDERVDIKFTPGERFGYSGEGFRYLQLVVERITGQNLNELIRAHVFEPLGMRRSFMVWGPEIVRNFATGYDESQQSVPKRRPPEASAIGSLHTTASDYARFLIAIMEGRGLQTRTVREMLRPQMRIRSQRMFGPLATVAAADENNRINLAWGLGFGLFTSAHGDSFFHGGHDEGLEHFTVCFRQRKTGIVVLTNSSNGESLVEELLQRTIGDRHTPYTWLGFEPYQRQE